MLYGLEGGFVKGCKLIGFDARIVLGFTLTVNLGMSTVNWLLFTL